MIAVSKTNTGLVRTANEDALLTDGPELFAIADGMGGYAGGEIASVETIKVLKEEKKKEFCRAYRRSSVYGFKRSSFQS